jgi:hypothetical protein
LTVVGDQAYSVIDLGLSCRRRRVRLIAPLRLVARLFAPPPPRRPGTIGRPRLVGRRLPKLAAALADPKTVWRALTLRWYNGSERTLEFAIGTALWYHNGKTPLPIRWVLSQDPKGALEPRCCSSTRPENDAEAILAEVIKRWPIEVPFAEARAHLGVETPRHWSDRAIARETPCLFGLSSLVALIGRALHQEHPLAIRTSAWYPKPQATFSDVLAAVRRHCGNGLDIRTSDRDPRCVEIPRPQWESLINSVCYAH